MELNRYLAASHSFAPQHPLILAVEDDEDSLLLLTKTLELFAYPFIVARDGNTALSLVQQCQPSLILLDILLPDLHGMEVLRRLKQNPLTAHIPVVALTAIAQTQEQEALLNAGCEQCLTKPYLLDDLDAIVRRYNHYAPSLSCV